ncbi:PTS mannitol transporter subunit IICBA [Terrilactibacillus sp. BCM23-1]|uniref:Mannitol-specific phosphotransferase enzyme IIA component n=1 Tax=Terrilactibacillus tamarindi TaxID=2599694 RepID=A0A6N8CSA7_9BACI|nr:PTS mannitol transporter subunit IICBA [Terrilactibacillus tamarindi]MTT32570.1 PTS mannitol transporter subunit IICBA [Terrilactibacillus tamarindi]
MQQSKGFKIGIQKLGNSLSSMVLPNIGAFIAWGLITALFIPTGWFPSKTLAALVDPTVKYLLPLLIGYTGGKLLHDHRGGVVGAIATMGIIIGTDIPMFLGAMIMGPIGGYAIKKVDSVIQDKVKPGFEMLIDNFSAGILGGLLAIVSFLGVGPLVDILSNVLATGVEWMIHTGILPLASIFIESGKILFLNNAINHGVLTPLGIEQVRQYGKSVLFLLEANPGPGMGVLLAYCIFGKGMAKRSAPGAAIIHFFGGIHEIYFPYILMKPFLFIAVILGGASGVFTFVLLQGGLLAPASPGSIIAILAVTPHSLGNYIANIAGVCVATAVSFTSSMLILKWSKGEEEDLQKATKQMEGMKGKKSRTASMLTSDAIVDQVMFDPSNVKKVVFACDAGMGSSAMGASILRKKVKQAGLSVTVTNTAISAIPNDAQVVVTQEELTPRAKQKAPNAYHVSVDNFLATPKYDALVDQLKNGEQHIQERQDIEAVQHPKGNILLKKNVFLNQSFTTKEEAIVFAGQILVDGGYVKESYIDAMIARDKLTSTFVGNGVAIPHGTDEAKKDILASGVTIIQVPEGVDFDGNEVRLLFGIAGKDGTHLNILSDIAIACTEKENVEKMVNAKTVDELLSYIGDLNEKKETNVPESLL